MGIGDWGLGIGDWGLGPIPNPPSPIPNPQTPLFTNPTIRHFLGRYKPINYKINFIEDWWFFAGKSKYYVSNATIFDQAFSF